MIPQHRLSDHRPIDLSSLDNDQTDHQLDRSELVPVPEDPNPRWTMSQTLAGIGSGVLIASLAHWGNDAVQMLEELTKGVSNNAVCSTLVIVAVLAAALFGLRMFIEKILPPRNRPR